MEKHGSESYFVIGEGLLGESGGRPDARRRRQGRAAVPVLAHGPEGQRARARRGDPQEARASDGRRRRRDVARSRPGFTYLGQFIDHDLTFDKTNVMLGTHVAPAELLQARSPSLDLDSLYGAGPQDPESAKFYEADGMHLKTGTTEAIDGDRRQARLRPPARRRLDPEGQAQGDHPRPAQRREPGGRADALRDDPLPQPRASTRCPRSVPAAQRFAKARELVAKHYQWMIRDDYLPRICARASVDDVFNPRPQGVRGRRRADRRADDADRVLGRRVPARALDGPRDLQLEQDLRPAAPAALDFLFTFSATSGDLGGGPRLPSNWIADFRRLYDFGEAGKANLDGAGEQVQPREGDRHAARRPARATCRRARSAAPAIPSGDPQREPRVPQPRPRAAWCGSRPASRWRRS